MFTNLFNKENIKTTYILCNKKNSLKINITLEELKNNIDNYTDEEWELYEKKPSIKDFIDAMDMFGLI